MMTPEEQRHAALSPLIEQFDLGDGGAHEVPACVSLGGQELELGVWEQSILRQARSKPSADTERGCALLAECMAFQARFQSVMERFVEGPMPPPKELPAFLDRLVIDIAVGLALQKELQREVSILIKSGELAGARNLASFRKKIVECGLDLKEKVSSGTFEQARCKATSLISSDGSFHPPAKRPGPPAHVTDPAAAPAPRAQGKQVKKQDKQKEKKDATRETQWQDWQKTCSDALGKPGASQPVEIETVKEPKSRTKPLLIVLGVLLAVWAVFILPRYKSKTPPELKLDQFSQFSQVHDISARPPSLFVKMDAQAWTRLSETDQLQLLASIAQIARDTGYVGMHVATTDGAAVGQWLEKTGVRLLTSTAGAS